MKKYTDHPRTIEQELLALDSIYKILTAHERILLHQSQNKEVAETTENIWKFLGWIEETNWKTPFMKYPEFHPDQLYFEDANGDLQLLED